MVIDPNVLVSAAITSSGAMAAVPDLIDVSVIVPIVSPALLAELSGVLRRDKFRQYLTVEEAIAYVDELERIAETWDDSPDPPAISPDRDDDYLIALARSSEADALVSGDTDVTGLELPSLPVLTPRELLDRLLTETDEQSGSGPSSP